jgi:prophage antirepressor-like protein
MENIFETLDENYIEFDDNIIHVIIDVDKKLWICANNLAGALEYKDIKNAIKAHTNKSDRKELQFIKTVNKIKGHPQTRYLTESGMYKLILKSNMPKAKKFNEWITNDVLPSIRKYGNYKLKKKYEKQTFEIMEKLNYIENENKILKNELKKEKFPNGGVVYAINYSTNKEEIYRIGKTGDMNSRKKIYDTHTLYKKEVIFIQESNCPLRLETCVRAMLYDHRYKNKKDFYICNLNKIKKAFKTCTNSIDCMDTLDDETDKCKGNVKILQKRIKILKNKLK